ncbi:MAG TPA: citrate/2-methylcitrate synthase [Pseudomonadales bacterium]
MSSKHTPDIRRGLEGVVADTTAISLVDGDNGILSYRGIPIDDLVGLSFGEVAALVVDGSVGTGISEAAAAAAALSTRERALVSSLPRQTHPMHVLQGLTPLLDRTDAFADRGDAAQGFAVAAKLPAIVATHLLGDRVLAAASCDPALRFLELIGAADTDIARRAYSVTQILQLEHGFNASTFVARATASTLAPVENALSAAFGTLHGVLHGGADQAALETADRVGSPEKAAAFVDECLAHRTRVMGMGHREYRVLDPRARYLKELAAELTMGTRHETTYRTLAAIEQRFTERMAEQGKDLYANLEFYKGVIYRTLGLPTSFFTANFALSRVYGYLAHFIESRQDNRLVRPKAHYVGNPVSAATRG